MHLHALELLHAGKHPFQVADPSTDAQAMAKSRKRPRSRGSTASIHSATTQQNVDQTFANTPDVYSTQWVPNDQNQQQRDLAPATHDMSAEALILHAASHLQDGREFSMEAPVNTSLQSASFHQNQSLSRQSVSAESFGGNGSFAEDSQMLDRDGNEDGDSFAGMPGNLKSGSRSSANNELEMRQLFVSNQHRNLVDVAEELHGNERGPNSERTRQVFAMLWYVLPIVSISSLFPFYFSFSFQFYFLKLTRAL